MNQAKLPEQENRALLDTLDELKRLATLETNLLRVLVHGKWTRAVSSVLPSEKERLAYKHSDGQQTSRQIAGMAGVSSHKTVTKWWRNWVDKGMGEHVPAARGSGQSFKARYTLLELAVAVLEGELKPH